VLPEPHNPSHRNLHIIDFWGPSEIYFTARPSAIEDLLVLLRRHRDLKVQWAPLDRPGSFSAVALVIMFFANTAEAEKWPQQYVQTI
jgi:hypothetical protein